MDDEAADGGVDRAAMASARAAVMAAATAAEQVLRQVWAQQERARVDATQRAQFAQRRYTVERGLARAALAAVGQQWLAHADRGDVERLHASTSTWAELEPGEFVPRLQRLREDLARARPSDAEQIIGGGRGAASPAGVSQDTAQVAAERERNRDEAAAISILAGVSQDAQRDLRDDQQQHEAAAAPAQEVPYDSGARRAAIYQRAVTAGVQPDLATSRVRAATAQAAPVVHAVAGRVSTRGGPIRPKRQETAIRRREESLRASER